MGARLGVLHFCKARICSRALKGARQIGQLLAWYRSESAQELHRHKCRHGRIRVSLTSHMQITHSEPLSSVSSSPPACKCKLLSHFSLLHKKLDVPFHCSCFQYRRFLEEGKTSHQPTAFVSGPLVGRFHRQFSPLFLLWCAIAACLNDELIYSIYSIWKVSRFNKYSFQLIWTKNAKIVSFRNN